VLTVAGRSRADAWIAPVTMNESRDSLAPPALPVDRAEPPRRRRDLRLDVFRGLALLCIFIDHIPGDRVAEYTISHIGFSDASELFIFISGYTAGLIYMAMTLRQGLWLSGLRVWMRVVRLYAAHLALFTIFIGEVTWTSIRFSNPAYAAEMNITRLLEEPHLAAWQALLLKFKPAYMDVLPLYIVLLAAFPLVLWLIRRSRVLALTLSVALYAATRAFALKLPAYPADAEWYFNPLAWQLLFVIGAVLGASANEPVHPVPRRRLWLAIAIAYVAFAFAAVFLWDRGLLDGLVSYDVLARVFPTDKTNLSIWRLTHLLALAYITTYFVRADGPFLRWRGLRPLIMCGQHSLVVFCLGVFLSFAGRIVLSEIGNSPAYQWLVNGCGLGIMIGAAALLTWHQSRRRSDQDPTDVTVRTAENRRAVPG
jgi:hypothetical protein